MKGKDEAPTPTLRGLIESIVDQKIAQVVEGPMPGRVTSYDSAKQRASVQPLVQRVYYDELGDRKTKLRPVVQDVPILFMGGNGTRITTGLTTGDTVLLIPCGHSISRWVVRGGEVDPGEERGSLADCIAIAGLHDFAHVPTTAPDDAVVVTADDIRLGDAFATEPTILGNTFETNLNTLLAAINAFAATCTTTPAGTPATTLATAVTAFITAWTVMLTMKVKVE